MDTITHIITGAVLAGPVKEKLGWTGAAAVVAGAFAPDADLVLRLFGSDLVFRYHRVVTNSLIGIAVFPFLVALIIWLSTDRRVALSKMWFCVFLGYIAHVFMDYTNSYGSPLFWPFSSKWDALDWVFIIEPWVSVPVIIGTILIYYFKTRPIPVVIACFSFLACYYGVCAYGHSEAIDVARKDIPGTVKVGAFPTMGNPLKWRIIAETDRDVTIGWYSLVIGGWDDRQVTAKPAPIPALGLAEAAPHAKRFLEFARFPLTSYERFSDGWLVSFRDLRFSRKPGEKEHFGAKVKVFDNGTIEEDR